MVSRSDSQALFCESLPKESIKSRSAALWPGFSDFATTGVFRTSRGKPEVSGGGPCADTGEGILIRELIGQ